MTEISEPDAADAKWKLQREYEEWTRERDSELEKRVPPDKASSKELMFNGQGELGTGGPRKREQPPNPMTETPCQHATSRDASHSSMHGQGYLPRSAASTERNMGPVTREVVRCGSARGTKQSIRPMARSHSRDGTGGVSLQVTDKATRAGMRGSEETDCTGDCLLPRLDAGNRSPEVTEMSCNSTGDCLIPRMDARNRSPEGDCLLPRLDAGNRSPEVTETGRRRFNFVKVRGGVLSDVTNTVLGN